MKIIKRNKFSILKMILSYGFVLTIVLSFTMSLFIANKAFADHNKGGIESEGINTKIQNPLGEGHLSTIPAFIEEILNIVIKIGIPIVTLAIIYAGFLFVQAQGNPEKLKKAKQTLLYTIIGAVLLLGAFVLAKAIGSTVKDITSTT